MYSRWTFKKKNLGLTKEISGGFYCGPFSQESSNKTRTLQVLFAGLSLKIIQLHLHHAKRVIDQQD
jgi:hypothetical protein